MRAVLGERLLVDPVAQQALAGLIEGAGRTEEKFHLQITGARLVPDAGGTAIAPPASAVAQNGHGHGNDTGEPA